ncbi:tripartite tricarboxylate transporter substrate binding protein [Bradyrhizobium sp. LHD-71]|uniref:Bug family tripartite tricarboxylate transporter substrate binding protein n=1 Tax=Bradyrhizobium sp. LHD-71 TaxID=3072141 RepID=UPI00280C46E5|nr:tripartite tricarboxylate transporter substrate binding protein [Bradyrhizobium sp. LHD-71]MDQ8729333.1 tripartite tricarboxylate transporter substrate binding protein [Bradyrhizobium sp. LHD-71]
MTDRSFDRDLRNRDLPVRAVRRRDVLRAGAAFVAASTVSLPALAQHATAPGTNYPNKPIKVLIPFTPGGNTDIIVRLISNMLSERVGQPVLVESKTGGGGMVAILATTQSPADGYALIAGSPGTHVYNLALHQNPAVNPMTDLEHITITGGAPLVLIVNKDLPAANLSEFQALLKREPNRHDFGSAGVGTSAHIAALYLMKKLGTSAQHVPYRGSASVVSDLLAGRVSFTIDTVSTWVERVKAGQGRALMVWQEKRVPAMPDTPSATDVGFPELVATSWTPWSAPKGTPKPIVQFLYEHIDAIMKTETVSNRIKELGSVETPGMSPERTHAYIMAEGERWLPIIRESGAKLE